MFTPRVAYFTKRIISCTVRAISEKGIFIFPQHDRSSLKLNATSRDRIREDAFKRYDYDTNQNSNSKHTTYLFRFIIALIYDLITCSVRLYADLTNDAFILVPNTDGYGERSRLIIFSHSVRQNA